jgi:outer membrane lipoprotein SlyB
MTFEAAPAAVRPMPSRAVWIVGGTLGLVSLAAAGTIAIRTAMPEAATDEPVRTGAATTTRAPAKAPERHAAVATKCPDCGVVESVRSVTRKGKGTGVGAVAGGVVGAALGNQVGKGNGRTAMTVLGAVGGGVAGNEVEKRARAVTVHEVRVRMDDGSLRTLEQVQPDAHAGDRVVVQGNSLKPVPGKG